MVSGSYAHTDYGCINDSSDGSFLFIVGLWPGCGYNLSTMLVWAGDEWEAFDIAAWWASSNAPGLVVSEKQADEFKEELVASRILEDPGRFFSNIPEDIEDLSPSDLCKCLLEQNADLFYDILYQVEESQEFLETFMPHDCGVYTYAQEGMCHKVDPEDFPEETYKYMEE